MLLRCEPRRNPFRVAQFREKRRVSSQGFKANPGLELANAFSVVQRRTSQRFQRNRAPYLISFIHLKTAPYLPREGRTTTSG
jgi:hypothetical protein